MIGLIRAEWLRLRKRRSLQIIVLGVPLLVGAIFVLGYNSLSDPPTFDEAAFRADMLAQGFAVGLPPEEAEQLMDEAVANERQSYEMQAESTAWYRARYVFPYSLVEVLGFGTFVLFALILLTSTTIGDDFNWATIRTALQASSGRWQFLVVRFGALALASLFIFGLLLVVGTVLPLVLNVRGAALPPTLPELSVGAFAVLLFGQLVATLAAVAFAALVTLLIRNGALTLVAALVYLALEAAVLTLLLRFENFQPEGADAWLLDAFPVRGLTTLVQTAGRAASGLPQFTGEVVSREFGAAIVPVISFGIVALVFAAFAFRRFQRMDIVE